MRYKHDAKQIRRRTFEKAGELGVAIRNVTGGLCPVSKGIDAVAEREQRLVDVGTFDKALARVLGGGGTLRTGKINHAQL